MPEQQIERGSFLWLLMTALTGQEPLTASWTKALGSSQDAEELGRLFLQLRDSIDEYLDLASQHLPGDTAQNYRRVLGVFGTSGGDVLGKFGTQTDGLSEGQKKQAVQINKEKKSQQAELIQLAIELVVLAALEPFFPAWVSAMRVIRMARTRIRLLLGLLRLMQLGRIAYYAGVEAISEVLTELAVQLHVSGSATPKEIRQRKVDWSEVGQAAAVGAFVGGFAGPVHHVLSGALAYKLLTGKDLNLNPNNFWSIFTEGIAEGLLEGAIGVAFGGSFSWQDLMGTVGSVFSEHGISTTVEQLKEKTGWNDLAAAFVNRARDIDTAGNGAFGANTVGAGGGPGDVFGIGPAASRPAETDGGTNGTSGDGDARTSGASADHQQDETRVPSTTDGAGTSTTGDDATSAAGGAGTSATARDVTSTPGRDTLSAADRDAASPSETGGTATAHHAGTPADTPGTAGEPAGAGGADRQESTVTAVAGGAAGLAPAAAATTPATSSTSSTSLAPTGPVGSAGRPGTAETSSSTAPSEEPGERAAQQRPGTEATTDAPDRGRQTEQDPARAQDGRPASHPATTGTAAETASSAGATAGGVHGASDPAATGAEAAAAEPPVTSTDVTPQVAGTDAGTDASSTVTGIPAAEAPVTSTDVTPQVAGTPAGADAPSTATGTPSGSPAAERPVTPTGSPLVTGPADDGASGAVAGTPAAAPQAPVAPWPAAAPQALPETGAPSARPAREAAPDDRNAPGGTKGTARALDALLGTLPAGRPAPAADAARWRADLLAALAAELEPGARSGPRPLLAEVERQARTVGTDPAGWLARILDTTPATPAGPDSGPRLRALVAELTARTDLPGTQDDRLLLALASARDGLSVTVEEPDGRITRYGEARPTAVRLTAPDPGRGLTAWSAPGAVPRPAAETEGKGKHRAQDGRPRRDWGPGQLAAWMNRWSETSPGRSSRRTPRTATRAAETERLWDDLRAETGEETAQHLLSDAWLELRAFLPDPVLIGADKDAERQRRRDAVVRIALALHTDPDRTRQVLLAVPGRLPASLMTGRPGAGRGKKKAGDRSAAGPSGSSSAAAGPSTEPEAAPGPSDPASYRAVAEAAVRAYQDSWFSRHERYDHGLGTHDAEITEAVQRRMATVLPALRDPLGRAPTTELARIFLTRVPVSRSTAPAVDRLLQHRTVLRAAVELPPLADLLLAHPALTFPLAHHPELLEALTGPAGRFRISRLIDHPAAVRLLATRSDLLAAMEADAEFRDGVLDGPDVLVAVEGSVPLLHRVLDDWSLRKALVATPALARAVLDDADPLGTLRTLSAFSGLTVDMGRPARGAAATPDRLSELALRQDLRNALRRNPAVQRYLASHPTLLRTVARDPGLLPLMAGAPDLLLALEENPRLAERLAGDAGLLRAAFRNPHLAAALMARPLLLDGLLPPDRHEELRRVLPGVRGPAPFAPVTRGDATVRRLASLPSLRPLFSDSVDGRALPSPQVLRVLQEEPDFVSFLLAHPGLADTPVTARRLFLSTEAPVRRRLLTDPSLLRPHVLALFLHAPDRLASLSPVDTARLAAADPELLRAARRDSGVRDLLLNANAARQVLSRTGSALTPLLTGDSLVPRLLKREESLWDLLPEHVSLFQAHDGVFVRLAAGHAGLADALRDHPSPRTLLIHDRLLETLAGGTSEGTAAHWRRLFDDQDLMSVLGAPEGLRLVGDLLRHGLLAEALARTGFLDRVKDTARRAVLTGATEKAALRRLVEESGPSTITPTGLIVHPTAMRAAEAIVLGGDRGRAVLDAILADEAATALLGGPVRIHAVRLMVQDTLRPIPELRNDAPTLAALLTVPELADAVYARPELVRVLADPHRAAMAAVHGNRLLSRSLRDHDRMALRFIATDLIARAMVTDGGRMSMVVNPDMVGLIENNRVREVMQGKRQVSNLISHSPAAARSITADFDVFRRLSEAPALAELLETLGEGPSRVNNLQRLNAGLPPLPPAPRSSFEPDHERAERLIEAVLSSPRTVDVFAADPGLLETLNRIDPLRDALASRSLPTADLLPLLTRATLTTLVEEPGLTPLALSRPELFPLLAQVPALHPHMLGDGPVAWLLGRPGVAAALAREPDFLRALADSADLRAVVGAHPRLAEQLAERRPTALALASNPGLLHALRHQRLLHEDQQSDSPLWRAMARVPALATAVGEANLDVLRRLRRNPDLLAAFEQLPRERAEALPAGVLGELITDPELPSLLNQRPQVAAALLAEPGVLARATGRPARFRAALQNNAPRASRRSADRDRSVDLRPLLTALDRPDPAGPRAAERPVAPQATAPSGRGAGRARNRREDGAPRPQGDTAPPPAARDAARAVAELSAAFPALAPVAALLPSLAADLMEAPALLAELRNDGGLTARLADHPELLVLAAADPRVLADLLAEDGGRPLSFAAHLEGRGGTGATFEEDLAAYRRSLGRRDLDVLGARTSQTVARLRYLLAPVWERTRDAADQAVRERRARLNARDHGTWELSGRLHYRHGLADTFTPLQLQQLRRAAEFGEGLRDGGAGLHHGMHIHLDSGQHGAALVYFLAEDHRVDTFVYSKAGNRLGNAYNWQGWPGHSSHPPLVLELLSSETLLKESVERLRRLTREREEARARAREAAGPDTTSSAPAHSPSGGEPRRVRPGARSADPVRPEDWKPLAQGLPYAEHRTERYDPAAGGDVWAGGRPLELPQGTTLIRARLRRVQARDGRWVFDVVVPLPVAPVGMTPDEVDRFARRYQDVLDRYVNSQGFVLGSGDQLHLSAALTVDPGHPDAIALGGGLPAGGTPPAPRQRTLHPGHSDAELLHEYFHYVGLGHGKAAPGALLAPRSTAPEEAGGVMDDVLNPLGLTLTQGQLDQVDGLKAGGPLVPEYPLSRTYGTSGAALLRDGRLAGWDLTGPAGSDDRVLADAPGIHRTADVPLDRSGRPAVAGVLHHRAPWRRADGRAGDPYLLRVRPGRAPGRLVLPGPGGDREVEAGEFAAHAARLPGMDGDPTAPLLLLADAPFDGLEPARALAAVTGRTVWVHTGRADLVPLAGTSVSASGPLAVSVFRQPGGAPRQWLAVLPPRSTGAADTAPASGPAGRPLPPAEPLETPAGTLRLDTGRRTPAGRPAASSAGPVKARPLPVVPAGPARARAFPVVPGGAGPLLVTEDRPGSAAPLRPRRVDARELPALRPAAELNAWLREHRKDGPNLLLPDDGTLTPRDRERLDAWLDHVHSETEVWHRLGEGRQPWLRIVASPAPDGGPRPAVANLARLLREESATRLRRSGRTDLPDPAARLEVSPPHPSVGDIGATVSVNLYRPTADQRPKDLFPAPAQAVAPRESAPAGFAVPVPAPSAPRPEQDARPVDFASAATPPPQPLPRAERATSARPPLTLRPATDRPGQAGPAR
ncbi:hypothetical protein AB0E83_24350, partial [Streptomyces sp. NPDC035033]|uniref:hypothetical protein n=1 Tax=Streptomyces sp. NPDC035033 TaxID=3155368 RepID=UPI0033DA8FB9